MCVCVCVCACTRVCVRAHARVCARVHVCRVKALSRFILKHKYLRSVWYNHKSYNTTYDLNEEAGYNGEGNWPNFRDLLSFGNG